MARILTENGAEEPPGRRLVSVGKLPDTYAWRISFCSPRDGWVLSDDSLWATSDDGGSWNRLEIPDTLYAEDPVVPGLAPPLVSLGYFGLDTCNQGWIQRGSRILQMQDQGRSWTVEGHLPVIGEARWNLVSISLWPGLRSGWASGVLIETDADGSVKIRPQGGVSTKETMHRTQDGGIKWLEQAIPFPSSINLVVKALSPTQAVAADRDRIFRTSQDGRSWVVASTLSQLGAGPCWNPSHFFFNDVSHEWLAYEDGCLFETTDAGQHWCLRARAEDIWQGISGFSDTGTLFFESDSKGWILGQDCQIHETLDGGRSWHVIPAPDLIHGFYCRTFTPGGMRCWATGTHLWDLR